MPSPDVSDLERRYQEWLRAEKHYRCASLGTPEAQAALAELERVWAAYEQELAALPATGERSTHPGPGPTWTSVQGLERIDHEVGWQLHVRGVVRAGSH